MVNYVNNSFDKVLKPCDAQQFHTLTSSEQTEKLILGHRAGEKNSKAKLPALTYMGVLNEAKYKDYLRRCEEQGGSPLGSRRAEFMQPTGLLMLDFDHVGDARALWTQIYKGASERGFDLGQCMALAHVTPSGDGLRLVVKRDEGKTIAEGQYHWVQEVLPWLGVEAKSDDVCKDISRLSFAPMKSEILYFNPSLLFAPLPDASDYPDGTLWGASPVILSNAKDLAKSPAKSQREMLHSVQHDNTAMPASSPLGGTEGGQYPTDYNGIPYTEIVRRLEAQLGGAPSRGARNSFIFSMACNLRYICNDDAAWVASILPTYGEDPQKHRQTIQSAINRPMSRNMPETMKRALQVSAESVEVSTSHSPLGEQEGAVPPALPSVLPEPLSMLVSCTPEVAKPAVAMAVFPSLGAYVSETRFVYADNRSYEPAFMNVLVAEQSAGKSSVNAPIHLILEDIKKRDVVALGREQEWKERCASISSTQDKPAKPKGLVVQILPADMTNAAFVQRLADAEGHFLYTQMDEIELLNCLKTNASADVVSAVLRLAFDCGEYGQVRVAANAVNALVNVRWNWNASSTVQRVRKFLHRNIADGTLSRLSFCTIIEDRGEGRRKIPKYAEFSDASAQELLPYLDKLKVCKGKLHCPEAVAWAETLNEELIDFSDEAEDVTYERLARRALLMGFFRAMLLYVMNGMQWTREIEDFATWSVKYDLWCKMRFFRDLLHKDIEGERSALQRGPVGLLGMLPKEFTREQVRDLRIAQGMKPDPRAMLSHWKLRGLIVVGEAPNVFIRV